MAVVEVDPSMRRSVQRLLNAHGYVTEEYSSALCHSELQRRLRASGSKLPVIFITALEDGALEAEVTQAGCVAYLRKPFPANLLINAINNEWVASTTD